MDIKAGSIVEILHHNRDFKGKLGYVVRVKDNDDYPYHVAGLFISPTPYEAAFMAHELKLICEEIDRG